jgi:hypothetical protein
MKKDFVIRGQTASGETEILEFGGYKEGYAYMMTAFNLWPSTSIGDKQMELMGSVTAAKAFEDPQNPNFNNEGLIAVAMMNASSVIEDGPKAINSIVNDTFLITQNLILAVLDTQTGAPSAVNWQCRFKSVKMTDAQAAVTNFRQFSIFDG